VPPWHHVCTTTCSLLLCCALFAATRAFISTAKPRLVVAFIHDPSINAGCVHSGFVGGRGGEPRLTPQIPFKVCTLTHSCDLLLHSKPGSPFLAMCSMPVGCTCNPSNLPIQPAVQLTSIHVYLKLAAWSLSTQS
jgi:hypothetical protein